MIYLPTYVGKYTTHGSYGYNIGEGLRMEIDPTVISTTKLLVPSRVFHVVIWFGENFGSKKGPIKMLDKFGLVRLVKFPTRWAQKPILNGVITPYNPHKLLYKCVTGVETLLILIGVIIPFINSRGPTV